MVSLGGHNLGGSLQFPTSKTHQAASLLLRVGKPPGAHLVVTVPKRLGCLIQLIAPRNEHSSRCYQESQKRDHGNYGSHSTSRLARQLLGTLRSLSAEPHQSQTDNGGTQTQLWLCMCVCVMQLCTHMCVDLWV